MIKNLRIENINKLKKYVTFDLNTNGQLYYDKNLIHKIVKVRDDFKDTIKYAKKNNIEEIVEVTNFIEDDSGIVGYSMINYSDYKSLRRSRRNIDLKLNDCKKIIKLFDNLYENNLVYRDHHTCNLLINNKTNDIKLCDLDTLQFIDSTHDKVLGRLDSLALCVSYIYNVPQYEARIVVSHSAINIDKKRIFRECAKSVDKDDFYEKVEKINNIDKTNLVDDRKKIKEEVKQYIKAGYFKFF